jgi:C_GCAxxG_C_C family probable redox protein
MISRREDTLLKAATGLEGGLVASGSTCGVVTGGALGLALLHEKDLAERDGHAEMTVIGKTREYVKWFDSEFGTTTCRERTGIDFYRVGGQLRYLFPGDRIARCLWHIGKAAQKLHAISKTDCSESIEFSGGRCAKTLHCAQPVLQGIRERSGVGDPLLESLSFVFDGGVALTGGVCGALAAAIMAINLILGKDIRNTRYTSTIKDFVVGHINILIERPMAMPNSFGTGKEIVTAFREKADAITCRDITQKEFKDWEDFITYRDSSRVCREIIDFSIEATSDVIAHMK